MQAGAVLAIARRRADAAEAYVEDTRRTTVSFRNGRLHARETRFLRGCGLRIINDGRLGFAASTNSEDYDELVSAAVEAAASGREAEFGFAGPALMPTVGSWSNQVMLLAPARMVDWGRELCAAMRARVPDLALDLDFHRTWQEMVIHTSAGLEAGFERAALELRVQGRIAGNRAAVIGEYLNLSDGREFDISRLCDRLETAARQFRRRAAVKTGIMPAVVMPRALPALLAPLLAAVAAPADRDNPGPLDRREGERIIADQLSIADNPLREHSPVTAPFDGEGTPTRRIKLFEHGVFRGFLHDRESAAACRTAANGAAQRDYASRPRAGTSSIEIAPGETALPDALRGITDGLLVTGLAESGSPDPLTGELLLTVTGALKVEKGEPVGRTGSLLITGNAYRLLNEVDMVGNELQDNGRSLLTWVRFPGLAVISPADRLQDIIAEQ